MNLRKDLSRLAFLGAFAVFAVGCRSVAYESMSSASAPNHPSPGHGDPYASGGIADGTGGQVAATTQTMETPTYTEPKFKKVAGNESFTSMSGHEVGKAKASDISGDYQPLPGGENKEGHEDHDKAEGEH